MARGQKYNREEQARYHQTPKGKATHLRNNAAYKQTEKGRQAQREALRRFRAKQREAKAPEREQAHQLRESERYMRSDAFTLPLAGPLRHLDHEEH